MPYLPKKKSTSLQASSSTDLIKQLRAINPILTTESLSVFMVRFANRFKDYTNGLIVRTDTTDHFVADLISYGWIKMGPDA